jgi:hypothetical protein
MIEVARYMLALIVALTHLQPLGMGRPGSIAVFAFYTLSGYLMTRVLNERYGFTARGTAAFLLNRVLRLWPAYFAILGLTLIALWFLPLQNFYPLIRFPMTPAEIVGNIAILGQVTFDFVQWSSLAKPTVTSWSLSIEVFPICCFQCISRGHQCGSGPLPQSAPSPWASRLGTALSVPIHPCMDRIVIKTGMVFCRPALFRLRWEACSTSTAVP